MSKRRLIHPIQAAYNEKFGDVPDNHDDRLKYIASLKKYRGNLDEDIKNARKRISRIKWETYTFTVYMVPQATQRPRHTFTGVTYVPHAAERADLFENFILPKLPNPPTINTPCMAYIDFYERTPSSFNQVKRILAEEKRLPNVTIRDIDNMLKAVLDFIQHGMLENDNKVYVANVGKWYSVKPRIEITIKYMTKDPYQVC